MIKFACLPCYTDEKMTNNGNMEDKLMLFQTSMSKVMQIQIKKIAANPNQARVYFKEEELTSLAESIKQNGILQPLSVRKISYDTFELIAGERRLRAAVLAGLDTVPCIIVNVDDKQSAVFCLLENLQRQDLGFFEEAEGISALMGIYQMTQQQIAEKLGKNQSTIANKLRLLKLTPEERKLISVNQLTERHARALLALATEEERKRILMLAIEKKMNVAEMEKLIELQGIKQQKQRKKPVIILKDVRLFLNTVSHAIETMKQSGISAQEERRETDDYIEYVVRIPKSCGSRKRTA